MNTLEISPFLLLMTLMSCCLPTQANTNIYYPVSFPERQIDIKVEIADTKAEREQGLMYRTDLPTNTGMLFVYAQPAVLEVWMKNTLLTLDVVFLDGKQHIVSLLDNLPPCRHSPCPIYRSALPAQYMLELPGGFIKQHQLKTGEYLSLPKR